MDFSALAAGIDATNNFLGNMLNNAWNQHNFESDLNQRINEFQANQIMQAQQFDYQKQQDELNRQQQQQQIDFNQNLANQQFGYQKSLQQQIFEREDNSVQRQIAGLRAAGLNPIGSNPSQSNSSVVGSMGSGSSVSPVSSNAHISPIGSTGTPLPSIDFDPINFMQQVYSNKLAAAQADKLKSDTFNTTMFQKLLQRRFGKDYEKMTDEDVNYYLRLFSEGSLAGGYHPYEHDANADLRRSEKVYQDLMNTNYDKVLENQFKESKARIEDINSQISKRAQEIVESKANIEYKQSALENEIKKVNGLISLYAQIGENYRVKNDALGLTMKYQKALFPVTVYKEYLSAIDSTISTIQDLIPGYDALKGVFGKLKSRRNKLDNALDNLNFDDLATDEDMAALDDLIKGIF